MLTANVAPGTGDPFTFQGSAQQITTFVYGSSSQALIWYTVRECHHKSTSFQDVSSCLLAKGDN